MSIVITFDIETLPATDKAVIDEIAANIQPPGNLSKPESIAKWREENYASVLDEKVRRTALDGLYGSVACIAWAVDDGPVCTTLADYDEATCLEAFFAAVYAASTVLHHGGETCRSVTFCGHNIAGFDLPFLKHRAIIHGIKPPSVLLRAIHAKPWDTCIADTMLMWSSDREKRVSMDKLCRALGIDGKGDMDGSMVADMWKTDPEKVIAYCAGDVLRSRMICRRLSFL